MLLCYCEAKALADYLRPIVRRNGGINESINDKREPPFKGKYGDCAE